MRRIGIVHFSGGGSTGLFAESVAEGARAVAGTEVELLRIKGEHIVEGRWQDASTLDVLSACNTIVMGAPTYMGGPAAQFKAFADATGYLWRSRAWCGKLAAGFTMSGNPSGDKLNTLNYLATLAGQHGMIWLNWDELPRQLDGTNHLGSYNGLMGQNPLPPGSPAALSDVDTLSARKFGDYVARVTERLG